MPAMLMIDRATATSASTAVISLIRSGTRPGTRRISCQRLLNPDWTDMSELRGRKPEHVPDPPQSVDQPRPAAVHLAAQHGHVGLDDPGVATEVVVPHVVKDLHLRQHPVGVAHEVAQQLELGG